jgi:osmotically-inducible protein OsmY
LVLLVPTLAPAQKLQTPLPDSQIRESIERQLREKRISGVQVSVAGGRVTLSGKVRSVGLKNDAIEIARKTHDVQLVISDLTVAAAESDQVIAREVASRVQRYVHYTVFDNVEGSVRKGAVTLTGEVTQPFKATEIANLVAHVQGVVDLKSSIKTLPLSRFDDELRYVISTQIYGDPLFVNYATQVNPPIHIIVENGNVKLTGAVGSQLEKSKAEMIARTTAGVFNVDNRLLVERAP